MVVKKVSTKAAVKKTTAKKTASKKAAKKPKQMVEVSGDLCFWVNNGPILSSLVDLHRALKDMSEDQFRHHVAKDKNDFAVWVGGVLCESECSRQLHKVKNKKEAMKVVEDAIKQYV